MRNILLITRSLKQQLSLKFSLIYHGMNVFTCSSLEASSSLLAQHDFSAIILHVDHPAAPAFEFTRLLRDNNQLTPVLYIGHKKYQDQMQSECSELEDYMLFPLKHSHLIKKVEQVMGMAELYEHRLLSPVIKLNEKECKLTVHEKTVSLNRIELRILQLLTNKKGTVVSLQKIYNLIEQEGVRFNTRIFAHISNLRRKFENAGISALSISFAKDGYRLDIIY